MQFLLGTSIYFGSMRTIPSQMAVVITSKGNPPGLTDALLDPLRQISQVHVSRIILVPGIHHSDQRDA